VSTSLHQPTLGFRLAAATNIVGVLVFSWGLTNERLTELSPIVFSRFGLISIMLWGMAYWAVASSYLAVPFLVAVFAIEKLIYVITWVIWIEEHGGELPSLFAEAPLTATFFSIYGLIDLAFGLFFAFTAMQGVRRKPDSREQA